MSNQLIKQLNKLVNWQRSLPAPVSKRLFWIWAVAGWVSLITPWAYGVCAVGIAAFLHLGLVEEVESLRRRRDDSS